MKKTIQANHRVEVVPSKPWFTTEKDPNKVAFRRCEDLATQIRRHIDDIESVSIECDYLTVCSYCGSPWTETGDAYNGGCCGADEANGSTPTEAQS